MIIIPKAVRILYIIVSFIIYGGFNYILLKKWMYVRCQETYTENKKFRFLWYIFLASQFGHLLSDLFEIPARFENEYAWDIRYLCRNLWNFEYTCIQIQISLLVLQVIYNTRIPVQKLPKKLFFLHALPIIITLPLYPYGLQTFIPLSKSFSDFIEGLMTYPLIINSILQLIFSLCLTYLFIKLIRIVKQNPLLRNSNKKVIKRWKIFLLAILLASAFSLLRGVLTFLGWKNIGPFYEPGEAPEGKSIFHIESIFADIEKLLTTIIIVFLSPYSYIKADVSRK